MPLSEYENRVLAELAAQLGDPRPAKGKPVPPLTPRRTVIAALLLLAGLVGLLAGVITALPVVGVAGFAVMLVGGDQLARPLMSRLSQTADSAAAAASAAQDRLRDRVDARASAGPRIEISVVLSLLSFLLFLSFASSLLR